MTNPTALLGKAEATIDWGLDAVAFAETSHTGVASRVIRSSFRKLGWKVLLGQDVRDKFATKSGLTVLGVFQKGLLWLPNGRHVMMWYRGRYQTMYGKEVEFTWVAYMRASCLFMSSLCI